MFLENSQFLPSFAQVTLLKSRYFVCMRYHGKILMLGWEYPPHLTGGLGTACHGLVNALKAYVPVTLVLPTFSAKYVEERLKIVGLSEQEAAYLERNKPTYTDVKTVTVEAELDFDPYPVGIAFEVQVAEQRTGAAAKPLFGTKDPYGPRILEKVNRYRDMAVEAALQEDFDIIHAHDWITVPAAIRLKELTGKPLVLHVHSLETDRIGEQHDFSQNAVYELERKGMEAADRVIPVSEYTKRCAVKNYGIDPAKMMPVYNAINPAETFRIDKPGDEKLVVFLGRITYQKGPEFMIESATKLLTKYKKVKFAVAGTGDKLDLLKAMVAQRGLKDRFVFTGFLPTPSVRQLLAQADVYFMPSVSEPFGLSALEAAQFEVPVIVSTQSGVSEVLPNTLQADFWDTDKFANFLFALLNYEGLRRDLVTNTNKDLRLLTWDDSAHDVLEVYGQVAG